MRAGSLTFFLIVPAIVFLSGIAPVFAGSAGQKPAGPPRLHIPVACELGRTCWVAEYMDIDDAPGSVRDYACGARAGDSNFGTVFALADRVRMIGGVDVLAAADGTVTRIRNDSEDGDLTPEDLDRMRAENKGCGNGIVLRHADGWTTTYCHMMKDGFTVKDGARVRAGQPIGRIGQSGSARMPQLHFGLYLEGQAIDPFSSLAAGKACGSGIRAAWTPDPGEIYEPVTIYATGFRDHAPEIDALRIDSAPQARLAETAKNIVFWAGVFAARAGDVVILTIADPDGRPVARKHIVQREDATRQFYYAGRRNRPGAPLVPGAYTGTVRIEREGTNAEPFVAERSTTVTVP